MTAITPDRLSAIQRASRALLVFFINVAQIRQVGLTYVCALAIWLVVLIGAAPEIAAAQDQWVQIMPSFPGGALMSGIFFLFASRIMNEALARGLLTCLL